VVDAAVEEVLDEARELTEEMFESGTDEETSGGGDASEPRDGRGSETQDE
jgi:hypothetical protein